MRGRAAAAPGPHIYFVHYSNVISNSNTNNHSI